MPASATPALAIPASRFVVPPCKPLVGLLPCRSASAAAAAASAALSRQGAGGNLGARGR